MTGIHFRCEGIWWYWQFPFDFYSKEYDRIDSFLSISIWRNVIVLTVSFWLWTKQNVIRFMYEDEPNIWRTGACNQLSWIYLLLAFFIVIIVTKMSIRNTLETEHFGIKATWHIMYYFLKDIINTVAFTLFAEEKKIRHFTWTNNWVNGLIFWKP